jgi:hypothetical protein
MQLLWLIASFLLFGAAAGWWSTLDALLMMLLPSLFGAWLGMRSGDSARMRR